MRHILLLLSLSISFVTVAQTQRISTNTKSGQATTKPSRQPATSAARPGSSTIPEVVYSYDELPTFDDHTEEGKRLENTLPAALPVLPLFNHSEDLPGYVDMTRRISFLMIEGLQTEVPAYYPDGFGMLEYYADRRKNETAPYEEGVEYIQMRKREYPDQEAVGYQHIMRYFSDGEWWIRNELQLGRYQNTPDGFHLVTIVNFYPAAYGLKAQQEVDYYLDNLKINSYE